MRGDVSFVKSLRRIDRIGFSVVSIGELFSGFKGGHREAQNRDELNFLLDSPRVVVHGIDAGTADFYASVLNNLKAAGTPIPTNDIWMQSWLSSMAIRFTPKTGISISSRDWCRYKALPQAVAFTF